MKAIRKLDFRGVPLSDDYRMTRIEKPPLLTLWKDFRSGPAEVTFSMREA